MSFYVFVDFFEALIKSYIILNFAFHADIWDFFISLSYFNKNLKTKICSLNISKMQYILNIF